MGAAFLIGFGLGAFVAAQIGPVSLLLMRTVLRGALASGLAIGAGAAVIDTAYAAAGLAGAAQALEVDALRIGLGIAGVALLGYLGVKTLWDAFRIRLGGELAEEVASPGKAFGTSIAATASNPSTIISWAAIFTAAAASSAASTDATAVALLAGVGIGSMAWFATLSIVVHFAGKRAGPRAITIADTLSGLGLLAFAGLLAARTARDA